jgi:hypothetical protein
VSIQHRSFEDGAAKGGVCAEARDGGALIEDTIEKLRLRPRLDKVSRDVVVCLLVEVSMWWVETGDHRPLRTCGQFLGIQLRASCDSCHETCEELKLWESFWGCDKIVRGDGGGQVVRVASATKHPIILSVHRPQATVL